MAITLKLLIILGTLLIPAAVASPHQTTQESLDHKSLSIATVLSTLGYHQLSQIAAHSLPTTTSPITIFAPSDNSLLTCPSCSLSLLLQEHSVPSLYPLSLLQSLPFGAKIQTLSPSPRCLTLTRTSSATTVYVNGAQITRPDLFKNNHLIIHGVRGFLSHLSPLSCNIESMTSLSFPRTPLSFTPFFIMRLMLKDAMLRLRINGYSVLALALREIYKDLIELHAATVFALDDESIFSGGHVYVQDLRFHIVPNRLLTAGDLVGLPANTVLRTMERGEKLVVTTAGGGGLLEPMRINYVKVKSLDLLFNGRVAVHGLAGPFRHIGHDLTADGDQSEGSRMDKNVAPAPLIGRTVEVDDYHGS